MEIKIIDGFVWLIVTRQAKEVFESNLFELYAVYDDGSEGLIYDLESLEKCIERGIKIGIEGGFINN
jgi:hypothetical protein